MRFVKLLVFLLVFLGAVETPFGKDAPSFWIKNLERQRFDSRKQDQPYVLSFFFVGCVPCIKEIPALYKLDPIGNRTTCATLSRHDQHRKLQ